MGIDKKFGNQVSRKSIDDYLERIAAILIGNYVDSQIQQKDKFGGYELPGFFAL